MKSLPSRETLLQLFTYNPNTGKLSWNCSRKKVKKGKEAGSVYTRTQYKYTRRKVGIDLDEYLVHRLVWKIYYGDFDESKYIDHIDGNPLNNRITNLRLVTHKENMRNTKKRRDNTSGIPGVCYDKQRKQWLVRVGADFVGRFTSLSEAKKARKEAVQNSFHKNHGKR